MHQQDVTSQTRRRSYPLFEVEQHVTFLAGVGIFQRTAEGELILEIHHAVGAVRLRSRLGYQTLDAAATVAGDVVPDRFQTVLRNREGVGLFEVLQTVATLDHAGADRIALGGFVDEVRHGGRAMGREHRYFVAFRITLEQGLLTRSQLVLVLFGVGRGDGEQRLLAGERIRQEAGRIDSAGILRQATGPGRNRAVRISGHLGTDWRQGGTQLGSLLWRHRCHDAAGQQRKGQRAGLQQTFCCFHIQSLPQNSCALRSSCRS
ncbi:hypothetical protein D3C85_760470 [compost metagenome]